MCTNGKIDNSEKKINSNKKNKDGKKEFPSWHQQHGVEPTGAFKKTKAFFPDVWRAIFIYQPATIIITIGAKAGVVIGFYFCIDAFQYCHTAKISVYVMLIPWGKGYAGGRNNMA